MVREFMKKVSALSDKHCKLCNLSGTYACQPDSTPLCNCKKGFKGEYCQICVSKYTYLDAKGECQPCDCPAEKSDRRCTWNAREDSTQCLSCNPGYGGLKCERCAVHYRYNITTAKCVKGPGVVLLLTHPVQAPSTSMLILLSLLAATIVLIAAVSVMLLCRQYCKRRGFRPYRMEDRFLLMENNDNGHVGGTFTIGELEEDDIFAPDTSPPVTRSRDTDVKARSMYNQPIRGTQNPFDMLGMDDTIVDSNYTQRPKKKSEGEEYYRLAHEQDHI